MKEQMAQLSAVEYMMGFSKGDKLAHRCSGAVS
jgi:flagellar hook assembly protein FlgD